MLEADNGPGLTPEQVATIESILGKVKEIGENIPLYIDPKFCGLMEIAFELLLEQIACDKIYLIDERPKAEDAFMNDKDIPSADDLGESIKD